MREIGTKKKEVLGKLVIFFKHPFIRENKPMLHTVEWVFVLLAFFAIGFAVIYSQEGSNYIVIRGEYPSGSKEALIQTPEEEKMFTGEVVSEPVDTTGWDTYQNKWYGFEIQHPDSWKNNTQYKTATEKSARYETIYKFRRDEEDESSVFDGYDVKIYPVKKVLAIEGTNDMRKKDGAPEDMEGCSFSKEENFKPDGSGFQKVSVADSNLCYEPAYFYSVTEGNYIYNIVPAVGVSGERFADPEKETTRLFPEYKEAVASFSLMKITRPQPKPKPKITARRPVAAKTVNGKLVCGKKNDKPRKSKNGNKPGHLDLECCLDPDERPNPWCTY